MREVEGQGTHSRGLSFERQRGICSSVLLQAFALALSLSTRLRS
jgi:hypothetical protein